MTFLFTDVEGSTRRWEADAEAMRIALAAHDEALRTAIAEHDGWLSSPYDGRRYGCGVLVRFGGAAASALVAQQLFLGGDVADRNPDQGADGDSYR